MERQRDHDLNAIHERLLEMGGIVEQMIAGSMRSLTERDAALAEKVVETDREVDNLEKSIDESCLSLMARQQPTAIDLRYLVAMMKIVNDLERMGDCAKNIARSTLVINLEPQLKPYVDLPRLARLAADMVRDCLDSLVKRDAAMARQIWDRDDVIDDLYEQLFGELLGFMTEDPSTTTRALHLLLVAQNLERIGDHATNVCEDVIYFIEGADIRHEQTRYDAATQPES